MNCGSCFGVDLFPNKNMNAETQTIETPKIESEKKLLKDVLEAKQKSDVDMLYVILELFKRIEALENKQ
jgi:hypothetical protein